MSNNAKHTVPAKSAVRHAAGWRATSITFIAVGAAVLVAASTWFATTGAEAHAVVPRPSHSSSATPSHTVAPAHHVTPTHHATPSKPVTPTVPACDTGDLSVHLGAIQGTAGGETVPIEFTSTHSTPCTIEGYPGVSFVGDGNGTQIGAAAERGTSTPITYHTLKKGQTVTAMVTIENASNYPDAKSVKVDGFRVYAPHSTASVFVPAKGLQGITSSNIDLLSVLPVA